MNASVRDGERLEQVRAFLRDYPRSVAAVAYAGDAPPLVLLGSLVTAQELLEERVPDPVLQRFTQRLKKARPDLSLDELLRLAVPRSAGDQEVYTARLGKWQFEVRTLARALNERP